MTRHRDVLHESYTTRRDLIDVTVIGCTKNIKPKPRIATATSLNILDKYIPGAALIMLRRPHFEIRSSTSNSLDEFDSVEIVNLKLLKNAALAIAMLLFTNVSILVATQSLLSTPASAAVIGDDYPSNLKNAAQDSMFDPWRFYNRECTSFVAWRLNSQNGISFIDFYRGVQWGNATNWGNAARSLGIRVDSSPAVGSVAWSSSGHVAWVAQVNNDGTVVIEEYNEYYNGTYDSRTVAASHFTGYIHIGDIPSTASDENSHTVAGDFNHDGYSDALAFYDYGGAHTKAFLFRGNPNGVNPPVMIWDSGVGNWEWSHSLLRRYNATWEWGHLNLTYSRRSSVGLAAVPLEQIFPQRLGRLLSNFKLTQ